MVARHDDSECRDRSKRIYLDIQAKIRRQVSDIIY